MLNGNPPITTRNEDGSLDWWMPKNGEAKENDPLEKYKTSKILGLFTSPDTTNMLTTNKRNEMVQNMQENREQNDLMGLGNALNTARQEKMNGLNNIVQTGMGVAKLGSEGAFKNMFGNKTTTPTITTPTITTPTITNDEVLTPIQNKSAGLINPQNINGKTQFNKSKSFTDPYWAIPFFK